MSLGLGITNQNQELHFAARDGDVERIHSAIAAGLYVNAVNAHGDTPLHLAVWKQSRAAIKSLIISGANVEKQDAGGKSSLEKAEQWGGQELSAYLKATLVEYRFLERKVTTLVRAGQWDELDRILEMGYFTNILLTGECTLLHLATELASLEVIEGLLRRGANVHTKDGNGRTALHLAAQANSVEALDKLLAGGADIHAPDENGQTALHLAAQADSVEALDKLLAGGADVHAPDKNRQTALHLAAQANSLRTLDKLLAGGADIHAPDENGQTALHLAAQANSLRTFDKLLAGGADTHVRDKNGQTALHLVAQADSVEALDKLLAGGANIYVRDKNGQTALHLVAQANSVEALDKLLAGGANIHVRDENGQTALHLAAQADSVEALDKLLAGGADVHVRDENGQTALHLAAQANSLRTLDKLLAGGADIHARDKNGQTALHSAAQTGCYGAARVLLGVYNKADILQAARTKKRKFHSFNMDELSTTFAETARDSSATLLLDESARLINLADNGGKTPLALAAESGQHSVIALLLANGATRSISSNDGGKAILNSVLISGSSELSAQLAAILRSQPSEELKAILVERSSGSVPQNNSEWVSTTLASIEKYQAYQQHENISRLLAIGLNSEPMFTILLNHWAKLREYLTLEFDDVHILDDIIVLVSDNNTDTWCTTSRAYVEWRWKSIGSSILSFINSALIIAQTLKHGCSQTTVTQYLTDNVVCSMICLDKDMPSVTIQGSQQIVQEVADIFGWIFDSLRFPCREVRSQDATVTVSLGSEIVHSATVGNMEFQLVSDSSCWHHLFPRKAISVGIIPKRPPRMNGLEIDYAVLILVTGVDIPTVEDDGIYLDGLRSALYPIHKDESGCLQWHFQALCVSEHSGDEDETPEFESDNVRTLPAVWYKTRVLDELTASKRHFVGWCSSAIITFGTCIQNSKLLDWSDAKMYKHDVIETSTNLNLNLSFHGIGVTAGRSTKRGKTECNPFEDHEENLQTALTRASKDQVLLLRSSTKQAWLVPKTSFLLQLIQSYMKQLMTDRPSLSLPIYFAEASYDGGQSAYNVLHDHLHESIPLGTNCSLSNIVRMFLHALGKLARSPEHGDIYGWEMKDLIDPPEYFDMKRQRFRRWQLPRFGGWNQLLPNMRLVFFFEGLDDPLIANELSKCAQCMRLPRDKILLGVTMASLRHFTRRFRSKYLLGGGQLTGNCFWNVQRPLFEEFCNGREHRCSAVQRILQHDRCSVPTQEELSRGEKGAVIFEPCGLSHEVTTLGSWS